MNSAILRIQRVENLDTADTFCVLQVGGWGDIEAATPNFLSRRFR